MTFKKSLSLLQLIVVFMFATALAPSGAHADSGEIRDWSIPGGRFYTQTNGTDDSNEFGYEVRDDEAAHFWTWYRKLGGIAALGYPVSQRFEHDGFVAQAFQKAILLWDANSQSVHLMNLFDELSEAGQDPFLETHRFIPPSETWTEDAGQPWPNILANHLALLEEDLPIKAAYYAEREHGRDPIVFNGLPMGIREYESVIVLRAQRRAFQHWKVDTPWASAGEVVVVNGGDLAKELGLVPAAAQEPVPAPVLPLSYGDSTEGGSLYRDKGCILCHGLSADGGIGSALLDSELEFFDFLAYVREPSEVMPAYLAEQLSDQEVRDIFAFVESLSAAP
jgi:mono/diheme cytochrome c family protein